MKCLSKGVQSQKKGGAKSKAKPKVSSRPKWTTEDEKHQLID